MITQAEIKIGAVNPPRHLARRRPLTMDEEGKIVEQENHFDPRDVMNPGWQNA